MSNEETASAICDCIYFDNGMQRECEEKAEYTSTGSAFGGGPMNYCEKHMKQRQRKEWEKINGE